MIEVKSLRKSFTVFDRRQGVAGTFKDLFSRNTRQLDAVNDVSFNIAEGEIVGYIGANGAGKSTTIKMLTGILYPTSGEIHVGGMVPHKDRMRYLKDIGVVFGQRTQLWWDLAAQESFKLLQKIYSVSDEDYKERMRIFDEVLALSEFLQTPVRKLSLGQKMRCEIAAALLHRPKVLFLDEPTIGLDIEAKTAIRAFLKQINRDMKVTMILTTHDLKDIEELCKRVMIIDKGSLLFDGQLEDLKSRLTAENLMTFHLTQDADEHLITSFDLKEVEWNLVDARTLTARYLPTQVGKADLIRRVLASADIVDFSMEEPSIEEVVRKVYRGGLNAHS